MIVSGSEHMPGAAWPATVSSGHSLHGQCSQDSSGVSLPLTSSGISVTASLGCTRQSGELGTDRDGDRGDILSRDVTNNGVPGIPHFQEPQSPGDFRGAGDTQGAHRGHGWGGDPWGQAARGHW